METMFLYHVQKRKFSIKMKDLILVMSKSNFIDKSVLHSFRQEVQNGNIFFSLQVSEEFIIHYFFSVTSKKLVA